MWSIAAKPVRKSHKQPKRGRKRPHPPSDGKVKNKKRKVAVDSCGPIPGVGDEKGIKHLEYIISYILDQL